MIDVADRENAGDIGLEGSRINRNEVLVQVQTPTGNRTELHREPEKREEPLAGDFLRSAVCVLEGHAGEFARFAGQGGNLAKSQIYPAGGDKLPHGLDGMRRGAKIVAAVNQGQMLGGRLKTEGPIEPRIAAADDHHMFAAKILDFADGVKDRRALVGLDTGNRRLLRLERTTAGRDDDGLALKTLPAAGADAKQWRLGAP